MPCKHKFYQDLSLQRLDFSPLTLIVGTFNPTWPSTNTAEWFYGRTARNFFWEVLPRLHKKPSLLEYGPDEWKTFCKEECVAITDLISCINDANETNPQHIQLLSNYSDSNIATKFKDHEFVNIIDLLKTNPTINKICFTRGAQELFWKQLWQPIMEYCSVNNIKCSTLITPSKYAFYQFGRYKKKEPNTALTLADFILMKWQDVC